MPALSDLSNGTCATVEGVHAATPEMDVGNLRRLQELGFLPGEPVQVIRRGPGGREPIAVLIGDTLLALRKIEAQCVQVLVVPRSQTAVDGALS